MHMNVIKQLYTIWNHWTSLQVFDESPSPIVCYAFLCLLPSLLLFLLYSKLLRVLLILLLLLLIIIIIITLLLSFMLCLFSLYISLIVLS